MSRLGLPLFLLPSFIDVYSFDKSSWETRGFLKDRVSFMYEIKFCD